MYTTLLVVMYISFGLLLVEGVYVFRKMDTIMHGYLFLYIIASIINTLGYIMEMTAPNSAAAYAATKFLYLGKIYIPVFLLLFIFTFCRIRIPQWVRYALVLFHTLVYVAIFTNDYHHLYYSSRTYLLEGLFPHNSFGHGPLYFVYQGIPFIYSFIAIVITSKAIKRMHTTEEKRQLILLLISPFASLFGMLAFFTGKTGGFDTTNLGLVICAGFMFLSLFRYNLIDTVNMVKNNMIDQLADGIIAVDPYGSVAYINETAKSILPGISAGDYASHKALIDDLEAKAKANEMIKVGEKVYSLSAKDLIEKSVYRGRLFVMDDMTATLNYTREIEQERDRADEANAAKSSFLSNMSHEIRTPMNAVVGITDILLRDDLTKQQRNYLENIRSSGHALLDIINDILDFSKIESGKMEIVNSDYQTLPLFNDLKVIFTTRIGDKPIRLLYDIDENLPAILEGDAVRIRQVVLNLVNNAIKFTEVGYVRLQLSVEELDADNINLKVSVQDSGQGIKEEDLKKLFNSFTQVDAQKNHAKEGTGLGLAISKQLVELMGGTISVTSEYGRGSDFFFTIPQRVVEHTRAVDYTYQSDAENLMNFIAPDASVLLVEDNEINVKVAQGLLEPLKFKMDVAQNGLASLKKVAENDYDLILMDHMMPVMDGIEATKRIRSFEDDKYRKIPIIALTANAVNGAKEACVEAGMDDFVGKPIELKEICTVLRKWLPPEKIVEKTPFDTPEADNMQEDTQESIQKGITKNIQENTNRNEKGENKMAEYGALDRETGLQYCGTEELYESVLEDFYRLIDSKSEKIETLLRDNDIRNYTIEVHALKSTARMIGAADLSALAFEMEQAGNANDLDKINANTPTLMEMYRAYKKTLAYFDGASDSSDDGKQEVPVATIKSELFKMSLAVKDFDMDGVDTAMKNMNSYKMPSEEVSNMVSKLDILVRDVDFEGIKELTGQIMRAL